MEKTCCEFCGKEYIKTRFWQKYCSFLCRKAAYNKRHEETRKIPKITQRINELESRLNKLESKEGNQ